MRKLYHKSEKKFVAAATDCENSLKAENAVPRRVAAESESKISSSQVASASDEAAERKSHAEGIMKTAPRQQERYDIIHLL